jgi:hypothetical protein
MIEAKDMHKWLDSGSEEYYESEIAEKLLHSSMNLSDEEFLALHEQLDNAVFELKARAQNPYNSGYWRVLWNVLQNLMDSGALDS